MNFTVYHSADPASVESFLERGIILKKHFNPHTSKEVYGFACTPFFEVAEIYAKTKSNFFEIGVIFEFFCEGAIKDEDFFYINSYRPNKELSDIIITNEKKINLIGIWKFNKTKKWEKTLKAHDLLKWILAVER
jgi:hypothetical protein